MRHDQVRGFVALGSGIPRERVMPRLDGPMPDAPYATVVLIEDDVREGVNGAAYHPVDETDGVSWGAATSSPDLQRADELTVELDAQSDLALSVDLDGADPGIVRFVVTGPTPSAAVPEPSESATSRRIVAADFGAPVSGVRGHVYEDLPAGSYRVRMLGDSMEYAQREQLRALFSVQWYGKGAAAAARRFRSYATSDLGVMTGQAGFGVSLESDEEWEAFSVAEPFPPIRNLDAIPHAWHDADDAKDAWLEERRGVELALEYVHDWRRDVGIVDAVPLHRDGATVETG